MNTPALMMCGRADAIMVSEESCEGRLSSLFIPARFIAITNGDCAAFPVAVSECSTSVISKQMTEGNTFKQIRVIVGNEQPHNKDTQDLRQLSKLANYRNTVTDYSHKIRKSDRTLDGQPLQYSA